MTVPADHRVPLKAPFVVKAQDGTDAITVNADGTVTFHQEVTLDVALSAVLSIAEGGTGATTAAAALIALGLTATASEINRVADVSARSVAAGGTLAVTEASHDGKVILLDTAAGSVATLPAATGSGAHFTFIVSVDPTSNSHVIQVAASTDDEFNGVLLQTDTDTSDTLASYPALPADNYDTITFAADGTQGGAVGDVIEIWDVAAATWALRGHVNGTGAVATPFSSAITS